MGIKPTHHHFRAHAQLREMTPPDSPRDEHNRITLPPIASLVSKSHHLHMHLDFIAPGSRSQSPVGGLGALSTVAAIARGSKPASPVGSTDLVNGCQDSPFLQPPRAAVGDEAAVRKQQPYSYEYSLQGQAQRYRALTVVEPKVCQPIPNQGGLPSPLHSACGEIRLPSPTESVYDTIASRHLQPQHRHHDSQVHSHCYPYPHSSPRSPIYLSNGRPVKSFAANRPKLPLPVALTPSHHALRSAGGSHRDQIRSTALRGGSRSSDTTNRSAAPRNERYPYDREERYALVYLRRTDTTNKLEWKDVVARYAILFPPGTSRRYKEPEPCSSVSGLTLATSNPKITGIPPWYPEREMQGLQCRLYRVRNDEGLPPCRDANASADGLSGEGPKQMSNREMEALANMAARDQLDEGFLRRVQEIASLPAGSI